MDNIEAVQVLDGACQIEQHTAGISLGVFVRGGDCIKEIAPLEKKSIWGVKEYQSLAELC